MPTRVGEGFCSSFVGILWIFSGIFNENNLFILASNLSNTRLYEKMCLRSIEPDFHKIAVAMMIPPPQCFPSYKTVGDVTVVVHVYESRVSG